MNPCSLLFQIFRRLETDEVWRYAKCGKSFGGRTIYNAFRPRGFRKLRDLGIAVRIVAHPRHAYRLARRSRPAACCKNAVYRRNYLWPRLLYVLQYEKRISDAPRSYDLPVFDTQFKK